jgi:hypothetical protein
MAFDLLDIAVKLYRAGLRHDHPAITDEELDARVAAWLHERPGAEHGDGEGRVVEWPRRR